MTIYIGRLKSSHLHHLHHSKRWRRQTGEGNAGDGRKRQHSAKGTDMEQLRLWGDKEQRTTELSNHVTAFIRNVEIQYKDELERERRAEDDRKRKHKHWKETRQIQTGVSG